MSRAFVKEQDEAAELPDRTLSTHANLVTAEGIAAIAAEVARWREAYVGAQREEDRAALAGAARELRYWTARRASARLTVPAGAPSVVRFGSSVTLRRGDDRRQTYRIVGEDEADPARGAISHVSPLARALMGATVGDRVPVGVGDVEVEDVR